MEGPSSDRVKQIMAEYRRKREISFAGGERKETPSPANQVGDKKSSQPQSSSTTLSSVVDGSSRINEISSLQKKTIKTPPPPKDNISLLSKTMTTMTAKASDRSHRFRFEPSSQPHAISSYNNASAAKRIDACTSRLFQTPSVTVPNPADDCKLTSSVDMVTRFKKLQTVGLLDKIKTMKLTSALSELNEDDSDKSEGKSSQESLQSSSSPEEDEQTGVDRGVTSSTPEVDDEKENTSKNVTVREAIDHNDSIVIVEEKISKNYPIQKKFTINSPRSRAKLDSSLRQTTIDKYFSKVSPSENPQSSQPSSQPDSGFGKETALSSSSSSSQSNVNTCQSTVHRTPRVNKEIFDLQPSLPPTHPTHPSLPPSVNSVHKERERDSSHPNLSSSKRRRSRSEGGKTRAREDSKDSQRSAPESRSELQKLRVNGKTYFLLSLIGQGGSARVYQVYDASTNRNLAVKVVDLTKADGSIKAGYENEILLLKKLEKCKRVVRLLDYQRVAGKDGEMKRLFLVMEKGDTDLANLLKQFIEKDPNSPSGFTLDQFLVKHYFKEMVKAVDEIHALDVVHSDLKPVNFITVAGRLKLIDFGIADAIDAGHTSVVKDSTIGTINYMAPEALKLRTDVNNVGKGVVKYNCKADIWSLGCILYNLVYGKPPFGHFDGLLQKVNAITSSKYKIEFPNHDDNDLVDCIKVSTTLEKTYE